MPPLNLGVVGLGEGRSILSAATRSDGWRVHTICDLDENTVRRRAEEFGVSRATTDFARLLAEDAIDVVAVYTPDPTHAPMVLRSLEAGKHVICTKPLFDGLGPARAVLDARRRAGRHVFVAQSTRFFEPMIRQRQDFEAGKHGEAVTVEAHYHHDLREWAARAWPGRATGPGAGINYAFAGLSHPVDLVRWYLPDVTEAMAYGSLSPAGRAAGQARPDTIHAILKTADGRAARVSGCYGAPHASTDGQDMISCFVRGDRGASHANYLQLRYYTNFDGEGERKYTWPEKAAWYFRFEGYGYHAGEFQNYLDAFARCLAEGRTPKPDLEEGIVTVAVLSAIDRSLAEGKPVRVGDLLDEHGLGGEGLVRLPFKESSI